MTITYEWRGRVDDGELARLHAEAFGPAPTASAAGAGSGEMGWLERLHRFSLGWVTARQRRQLVGFVNVPWDGAAHAFLIDTMVASSVRRSGVGRELVAVATRAARAAGCRWLHVDFEPHLRKFYLDACGFTGTDAGLRDLQA